MRWDWRLGRFGEPANLIPSDCSGAVDEIAHTPQITHGALLKLKDWVSKGWFSSGSVRFIRSLYLSLPFSLSPFSGFPLCFSVPSLSVSILLSNQYSLFLVPTVVF